MGGKFIMSALLDKAFDFCIRSIELVNYLEEEKRPFPLANRLLECAEETCVCLRMSFYVPRSASEYGTQALKLTLEAECLLELMVKTGIMSDMQSAPILTECRFLKNELKSNF